MAPKKIKNKAKRVPKKTIKRRVPPAPFATSSAVVNVYQQPFNEPRTRAPSDFFSSGDKGLGKAISTPAPVPATMASQLRLLKSPISLSSQSQAIKARASLPVNPTRAEIEGVGLTALLTERIKPTIGAIQRTPSPIQLPKSGPFTQPLAPSDPTSVRTSAPVEITGMRGLNARSIGQQARREREREALQRSVAEAARDREESSENLAPDY